MANKLLSGRYFLTVACGVAFCYCVWTRQFEPAAISAIMVMVFRSYFEKKDRNNNDGKPN